MYGLYGISGPYIVLMYGSNPYIFASMYGFLASVQGSKIFNHTLKLLIYNIKIFFLY